jgi:hypothetical protein
MGTPFDPREHLLSVSLASLVLLVSAIGVGWGLGELARAPNAKTREAALTKAIDGLKRRERDQSNRAMLARGTLCHGDLAVAEEALRQRLQVAVVRSGGTVVSALTASEPPRLGSTHLSTVAFELEASGKYDALVQSLGELARAEPTIFARHVELVAEPGGVNLKLKGEVLCWTPA